MNADNLEFVIFCIENTAKALGINPENLYNIFSENSIIASYIVPNFDVLHTQGKEYIVNDLIEILKEKGIKI